MTQSYLYLESCIGVIESIDPQVLAACRLARIEATTVTAEIYELGEMKMGDGLQQTALKVPRSNAPAQLLRELSRASWLVECVPELIDVVPGFMGCVALTDALVIETYPAIITEYKSCDTAAQLEPIRLKESSKRLLAAIFASIGEPVDTARHNDSPASPEINAGTIQQFLSTIPSIFAGLLSSDPGLYRHREKTLSAFMEGNLSVLIPQFSELAVDLTFARIVG